MKKKDKAAFDRPTTIICKDTIMEAAKLNSTSNVQVSGQFYGDMDVVASLVIGETGKVIGNIKAEFVLLAGEVHGNINVTHQLHITQTARVKGDVVAGTVIIDEGAHLEGGIKMRDIGNEKEKVEEQVGTKVEKKVEMKVEEQEFTSMPSSTRPSGASSIFD